MTDDLEYGGDQGLEPAPYELPDGTDVIAADLTAVPGYDTLVFDGVGGSSIVVSDLGDGARTIAIDDDRDGQIDRAYLVRDGQAFAVDPRSGEILHAVELDEVPVPELEPEPAGDATGMVDLPSPTYPGGMGDTGGTGWVGIPSPYMIQDDPDARGTIDLPGPAPQSPYATPAIPADPDTAYPPPAFSSDPAQNIAAGELWRVSQAVEDVWESTTGTRVPLGPDGAPIRAVEVLERLRDGYTSTPEQRNEIQARILELQRLETSVTGP